MKKIILSIWFRFEIGIAWAVLSIICMSNGIAAHAASLARDSVIPINNGINRFTLGGKKAFALRAWRENFNGHGFDVVSFYVRYDNKWNIVPLFGAYHGKNEIEHDYLTTGGGADCMLHDFRLLKSGNSHAMQIIVADRELGESYADSATVHFSYYELEKNSAEVFGQPLLYFNFKKATRAMRKYCDVNDAFNKELPLPGSQGNAGPPQVSLSPSGGGLGAARPWERSEP
jgi:hypothetical protein